MATSSPDAPRDWKRVSQLVADALELPSEERPAWLATACAGDEVLRCEVASLLAAEAHAGSFLQRSALASTGAADLIASSARESLALVAGRRVGPYQIVRELGHGGMGVVYLAARADLAFEKQVAVKVVRGGAASALALQRFADERRILATLEHPHIARLLDGGVTADGLSYLVMEYVDGVPLDVYCHERRVPLPERLRLFRDVASAVEYAHQRLVIHRDIKPGNILVTSDGAPKLLDFGIARLLDQNLSAGRTSTGLRAFTLAHASPEQIRGEPMAVTSDVYSLGVLLYQLMTGHRPYGVSAQTDADLMRAICEEPPVRPVVAARTGTGFTVSIELEWIVLKALRKEPDRRYESVARLLDDLDRLASARPVLAGPDSRRYRARKFLSRYRTAVAAGALLALSLVAGMTTTLWQARRAEQARARAELRFQTARRLANAMVFELNDAIEQGATAARALLLTRASEQLDALALDSPDDPALAEDLATAYHRLGDVYTTATAANLGAIAPGLASHRKGLALRRDLARRTPNDLEARYRLGTSLISTAFAEDQIGPSVEHAQAAVGSAESLMAARPDEPRFRRQFAQAHYALGSQYRAVGNNRLATASFETASAHFEAVYGANTSNPELRSELAVCHRRLGAILNDQRQFPQALGHLRKAVELDQITVTADPRSPSRRRDLSTSHTQLGFALARLGDPRGALAAYGQALALREQLSREDPTNSQAVRDLATALWYIGMAENASGNPTAAVANFRRALPLSQPRSDRDQLTASIVSGLADSYEAQGDGTEALNMRRQALALRRVVLAGQPKSKALIYSVAADALALGETLMNLGARQPARRVSRSRDACVAFEEGWRLIAGDAVDESPNASIADRLRQGRAQCERAATP